MHLRYTPRRHRILWSDTYKYQLWSGIELEVLSAQAEAGAIPRDWYDQAKDSPPPSASEVYAALEIHQHEMAAFLSAWGLTHVHIGVTSSDIIDLEQASRICLATEYLQSTVLDLDRVLSTLADDQRLTTARTHGQAAASTATGHIWADCQHRIGRTMTEVARAADHLASNCKVRGPVGAYLPPVLTPQIEQTILDQIGCRATPVSTQVAPRDLLVGWSDAVGRLASALSNLALQIRLMAQTGIGEVVLADEGIGSSSMPHKTNPAPAEQICGLEQVVTGLCQAMRSTQTLWGHRDLSNSSIERVCLPQIAAYTDHMAETAANACRGLAVLANPDYPTSNASMTAAQLRGDGYWSARLAVIDPLPPAPPDWAL